MSASQNPWRPGPEVTGGMNAHSQSDKQPRQLGKIFDAIDLTVNESNGTFNVDQNVFNMAPSEFDPTSMKTDGALLILGKRRTGKSHLLRDLLCHYGSRFSTAIVLTGTKFNGYWQEIVPEEYIYEGFDEGALTKAMAAQKQVVQECRESNREMHEKRECECNMIVILDDVASEDHLQRSLILGKLYTAGRHFYITPVLLTQYAYACSPAIRSNVDYAFIMHQTQRRSKEAIADEWLSQVKRVEAGGIMSKHTPGYQVLVIDNSKATDELSEVLSTYTAMDEQELAQCSRPIGHEAYYEACRKDPVDMGSEEMKKQDAMNNRLSEPMLNYPRCLQAMKQDANLLLDSKYI